ncbi:MAG: DegT/DnrJ/EryC1/StrS family aminotransferase [Sphingobacteriales bacterium]|nr:MAG: DegT/DnrJ/EryC1/StrS family aminotransferase [Sphingobacteriales bacterium]
MINVTKTFLPPFEDYTAILRRAWDKAWITNNGELVMELETKLKQYLDVKNLWFTSNGTVVLQMALKALNITKEVITTPFSYVATTNAIIWEGCTPVFVDIDPQTFCLDASKIEAAITKDTQAILATHVYGLPCDVEAIEIIAKKHKLKIIYDAAHAFGVMYKGKSLLSYGDISTCSFHATKLFHTVEGGCIICNDDDLHEKLFLYRSFGHIGDDYFAVGINGKNSEFHAAMGLALLPYLPQLIEERKVIFDLYEMELSKTGIEFLNISHPDVAWNYAYCPVLFKNEEQLLRIKFKLEEEGIFIRRYFFPSLNQLPFLQQNIHCPISENIALRVAALPLYPGLTTTDTHRIVEIIKQNIQA